VLYRTPKISHFLSGIARFRYNENYISKPANRKIFSQKKCRVAQVVRLAASYTVVGVRNRHGHRRARVISEAWRELPDSVIQNCWQHADVIPWIQEKDHFISHREYMEHIESGARTAIESLPDIHCNSEQTANAARQSVFMTRICQTRMSQPLPLIWMSRLTILHILGLRILNL
jgi:hypothetical protein